MELKNPFNQVKRVCVGLCYVCNIILLISAMAYLGKFNVNMKIE